LHIRCRYLVIHDPLHESAIDGVAVSAGKADLDPVSRGLMRLGLDNSAVGENDELRARDGARCRQHH
jgi:hypothetical protein